MADYTLSDLRTLTANLLGEYDLANNARLNPDSYARMDRLLNEGLREVYRRVPLVVRSETIAAVDEQAEYTLPLDMATVEQVYYDGTLLKKTDIQTLTTSDVVNSGEWRDHDAGTPSYWYRVGTRKIGLNVKPDVTDETLVVYGYVLPYSVSISSITRASNVTTVTTSRAHGLSTNSTVRIYNVTGTGFDTTSAAVVAVPTSTTFTYANTGGDGSGSGSGHVGYAGGVLPLIATTDYPDLAEDYQAAPAYWAAAKYAKLDLNDSEAILARAGVLLAEFEQLIGDACFEAAV